MPRCDDCSGTRRCSCVIVDGDNTEVLGAGSPDDPYRVNVDVAGSGGRLSGEIAVYGGSAAPPGWLLANGQAVSRTTYADLFAILGTSFGAGDGSTSFNVPDLAGTFPLGADGTHARGSTGGLEQITLTQANLPAHVHTIAHTHGMGHAHGMGHTHDMSHGHGSTGSAGNHGHTVHQSNNTGSNNTTVARGSQNDRNVDTSTDGAHTHGIPGFGGSTGGDSRGGATDADNRGGVTDGPSAANSGSVGAGVAYTNMPPYVAVTFIIKT